MPIRTNHTVKDRYINQQLFRPCHFLIIVLLISVVGCQYNSDRSEKKAATLTAKEVNPGNKTSGSFGDTTIVNQEFSYNALGVKIFRSDTNMIKLLFLDKATLKIEKRKNSESGEYNEYHFTDGINNIILYLNDGFYLEHAYIKNNRILLNKKISFGMKKDEFFKLLTVSNIKCDTVSVVDEEYSMKSVYVFKNGKLNGLIIGQTVE